MILAPAVMAAEKLPKNAATKCLEAVGLDQDLYRIGNTKARILWSLASVVFQIPIHFSLVLLYITPHSLYLYVLCAYTPNPLFQFQFQYTSSSSSLSFSSTMSASCVESRLCLHLTRT